MVAQKIAEKRSLSLFRSRCPGCGGPLGDKGQLLCSWCSIRTFPDGERSSFGVPVLTAFLHKGIPRELVIRLKFNREKHLAGLLARLALLSWKEIPSACDRLVPIPVSSAKLRKRGFNQAALLASAIGRITGAEPDDILACRRGEPQVGLSAHERRKNIRGRFSLKRKTETDGTIWLIDDVMTTGATVSEAFAVLGDAGISRVRPAVVCFRKPSDESIIRCKEVDNAGV